jgi:hypothetical protein
MTEELPGFVPRVVRLDDVSLFEALSFSPHRYAGQRSNSPFGGQASLGRLY